MPFIVLWTWTWYFLLQCITLFEMSFNTNKKKPKLLSIQTYFTSTYRPKTCFLICCYLKWIAILYPAVINKQIPMYFYFQFLIDFSLVPNPLVKQNDRKCIRILIDKSAFFRTSCFFFVFFLSFWNFVHLMLHFVPCSNFCFFFLNDQLDCYLFTQKMCNFYYIYCVW